VFSASVDMKVIQWSRSSGVCVQSFEGHTREVTSLCSLGPVLFSSSDAGMVLMQWAEGLTHAMIANEAEQEDADNGLLEQLQEALLVADKQRGTAIVELRAIGTRLTELEDHINQSDERRGDLQKNKLRKTMAILFDNGPSKTCIDCWRRSVASASAAFRGELQLMTEQQQAEMAAARAALASAEHERDKLNAQLVEQGEHADSCMISVNREFGFQKIVRVTVELNKWTLTKGMMQWRDNLYRHVMLEKQGEIVGQHDIMHAAKHVCTVYNKFKAMRMTRLVLNWHQDVTVAIMDQANAEEEKKLRNTMQVVALSNLGNMLERWKRKALFFVVHQMHNRQTEAEALKTAICWASMSREGMSKKEKGSRSLQFLKRCRRILFRATQSLLYHAVFDWNTAVKRDPKWLGKKKKTKPKKK